MHATDKMVEYVFQMTLLFALFLSFYIFVKSLLTKKAERSNVFNTWQFPMILAVYLDSLYI